MILLVDDEEIVTRAVVRFLRRRGFAVASANTAAAARRAGEHAVGIFDIDLAGESGIDLAHELLAAGRVGHAIFFTGSVDPELLRRARELGPVVSKGEGPAPLVGAIRTLLA